MFHPQLMKPKGSSKGQAFLIRVKFRRNNCWQGTIQWLEGEKTSSFRSLLEMIFLIHEALETADTNEYRQPNRSWEHAEHF